MRVFVALLSPPELQPVVDRYMDIVSEVEGTRALESAMLHMTVITPWEEKDPQAVLNDFSAIASTSITLTFDNVNQRHDGPHGSRLRLVGPSTPKLERLSLQAWRAIKSHDPPARPLPHVTFARFAEGAHLPALPQLGRVTATFERLCLMESLGDAHYRIIGERKLEKFMLPLSPIE